MYIPILCVCHCCDDDDDYVECVEPATTMKNTSTRAAAAATAPPSASQSVSTTGTHTILFCVCCTCSTTCISYTILYMHVLIYTVFVHKAKTQNNTTHVIRSAKTLARGCRLFAYSICVVCCIVHYT